MSLGRMMDIKQSLSDILTSTASCLEASGGQNQSYNEQGKYNESGGDVEYADRLQLYMAYENDLPISILLLKDTTSCCYGNVILHLITEDNRNDV